MLTVKCKKNSEFQYCMKWNKACWYHEDHGQFACSETRVNFAEWYWSIFMKSNETYKLICSSILQNYARTKTAKVYRKVSRCADYTFVDITASEKVCFNDFRDMKFIYLHCGEETNLRDPRRFVLNYAPKLFVKSTKHNSLIQTVKPSFFKEINFQKNLTWCADRPFSDIPAWKCCLKSRTILKW